MPVEITVKLLLKAMEASGKSKFLIDGFPRDKENLLGWESVVGSAVHVPFVLQFDAPEEVMLVRLLKRGETSGRVDDNITSIRKRFLVYTESTLPVVHKFEREGKLRVINASQVCSLGEGGGGGGRMLGGGGGGGGGVGGAGAGHPGGFACVEGTK